MLEEGPFMVRGSPRLRQTLTYGVENPEQLIVLLPTRSVGFEETVLIEPKATLVNEAVHVCACAAIGPSNSNRPHR